MTPPTFDYLIPPADLCQQWNTDPFRFSKAAAWGARHGYEQGRKTQQWPLAIDGLVEPPEEKDGDVDGRVQYQADNGLWGDMSWREAAATGVPWLHTPRWQPRRPSLKEQALAELSKSSRTLDSHAPGEKITYHIRKEAVELIRRALEQAGEGVEHG